MQGRGGCLFHSSPGIRVKSRHLFDQTGLKFVVCWIFLFHSFFKKRRYWKAQAKTKGSEQKVFVILCCEILYQFLADCEYRMWRQASHKHEQKKRYTLNVYSFKPAD